MCTQKQNLHKHDTEKKQSKDKPNEAEIFFLLNEDILH